MGNFKGIPEAVRIAPGPRISVNHEFASGEFKEGEKIFAFEFMRNLKSPTFLLTRTWITSAIGKEMWQYQGEKTEDFCILYQDRGGTMVIGFIKKGTKKSLINVIPVAEIKAARLCEEGFEYPAHRQPKEMLELRRSVADFNGLDCPYLQVELKIAADEKAAQEKKDLQIALAKKATLLQQQREIASRKDKKQHAKEDRKKRIHLRPEVVAYDQYGQKCHGIPVTESEWRTLDHNRYGVRFVDYDEINGPVGEPIEAFQVKKDGTPRKAYLKTGLSRKEPKPEITQKSVIAISKKVTVDFGVKTGVSLPLISSDQIPALRKSINGGSITVAIMMDNQKYQILVLRRDGVDTLGEVAL